MKKKLSIVFIVAVLTIILIIPASAVTFGEPDGNDHPYVGLMYFETPTGVWRCTGTLLSPTMFLTAGHCTEEFEVPNFRTWVNFSPEIIIPDDVLLLPDDEFGDWLDTQTDFIKGEAFPHPDYDDFSEWPNTYDIGIVILDEEVILDEYGQLPPIGFLDTLVTGKGRKDRGFTAVGYGLQGYNPAFYRSERTRYRGEVSLIEVNSASNGDQHSAKFSNNPGGGNGKGGTCFGDSGGPLFHGDSNMIGAVVSWGITPCIGVDYQFRVDTDFVQDFINSVSP
jgi:hypothetical protein